MDAAPMDDTTAVYLDTVRGWDLYEQHHGNAVIDFDLAPAGVQEPAPIPRHDAVARLEQLRDAASPALTQRIDAHIAYAHALDGHRAPLNEYLAATMGFTAHPVADGELEERYAKLEERLEHTAWHTDPNPTTILAAGDTELDADAFAAHLRALQPQLADQLEHTTGIAGNINLNIETCDQPDDYWAFWIDGTTEHIRLRLNTPNAAFYPGAARVFCAHELTGHATQITNWAQNTNTEPAWHALSCVHTPEQTLLEGVALNMLRFLPELDDTTETFLDIYEYRQLVAHNTHLIAQDDLDAAHHYTRTWAPWVDNDALARDNQLRHNSPVHRTYLLSYPAGATAVHAAATSADPTGFLRWAYHAPRAPREINEWLTTHGCDTATLPYTAV